MQPPFGAQAIPGLQQPRPGPHHVPLLQCCTWVWACAANASANVNANANAANSVRATIVFLYLRLPNTSSRSGNTAPNQAACAEWSV